MNATVLGILIVAVGVIAVLAIIAFVTQSSIQKLGQQISQTQRENESRQSEQISRQSEQMGRQSEQINAIGRQLNDTITQISRSMGEMQNLSTGVEDLRRMMSNVKSRGIIGEIQLGAILDDILAPEQYNENVAVKGGTERVEFAVKFPAEDGGFVYLPIDSKFPGDAYINLLDAYDTGDKALIKKATDGLKYAIAKAAKDISTKYIYPPFTTEFGIMFLPFEGLYAEVLRLNIVETLQKEYRINIAGPTTMAAMLNSFQLGFKSLALQQSSGEVWDTLAKVKTEFDKFSESLNKTQMRLDQAQNELEALVGTRTRSIQKVLEKASEGKK